MGSPISAVIADLYMEAFEEQTLATAPEPQRIWKCYVDDTFTVMKQHNADNFFELPQPTTPVHPLHHGN